MGKKDNWFQNLLLCQNYFNTYNDLKIPYNYEIKGVRLGLWLYHQRQKYKSQKLSEVYI